MKKLHFLSIIFAISLTSKGDSWVQKASYPGLGLRYPFSFTIGNLGYVGCGDDSLGNLHNDFWEYDPSTDAWTQKANFGGVGRSGSTGFSIGNKGYAGLGTDSSYTLYKDFWEYDQSNNIWTQKADFGGGYRIIAIGFAIGNMGFIGTGANYSGPQTFNDFWEYDPITNLWLQKASLPGASRGGASCFVIGNNGYIVAGWDGNNYLSDLWEYNIITDSWSQKTNFPSNPRVDAAAFTICDKGYFGVGFDTTMGAGYLNDLWQYNPVTNIWIQKANFSGSGRNEPAFFSIGNKGYIGLGGNNGNPRYRDFYEYTPDSGCTTAIDELSISNFTIYPNLAKAFTVISWDNRLEKKNVEIKVFDTNGKIVFIQQYQTTTSNIKLPVANLPTGIYFVQVTEGENKVVRKMVVE